MNVPEVVTELFGSDYAPSRSFTYDFALSESPLGPSSKVFSAIQAAIATGNHYPDKQHTVLKRLLSDRHGRAEETFYIDAGVTRIIQAFIKLFVRPGMNVVLPRHTFPGAIYGATGNGGNARLVKHLDTLNFDFSALEEAVNPDTAFIFLCNPNNPTGFIEDPNQIIDLAKRVTVPVLVSEANIEYCGGSVLEHASIPDNLAVFRSFSKAYALAGFRVGYAVCAPKMIAALHAAINPFNISSISEAAACAALSDQQHLETVVALVRTERTRLQSALEKIGIQSLPSVGNTFLAKVPEQFGNTKDFIRALNQEDCSVVDGANFHGLDQFVRIAPRTPNANTHLISVMEKILAGAA